MVQKSLGAIWIYHLSAPTQELVIMYICMKMTHFSHWAENIVWQEILFMLNVNDVVRHCLLPLNGIGVGMNKYNNKVLNMKYCRYCRRSILVCPRTDLGGSGRQRERDRNPPVQTK